jgi:hypothetical protein
MGFEILKCSFLEFYLSDHNPTTEPQDLMPRFWIQIHSPSWHWWWNCVSVTSYLSLHPKKRFASTLGDFILANTVTAEIWGATRFDHARDWLPIFRTLLRRQRRRFECSTGSNPKNLLAVPSLFRIAHMAVCQTLVPLVNIKIAGKWMFIP